MLIYFFEILAALLNYQIWFKYLRKMFLRGAKKRYDMVVLSIIIKD